MGEARCGAYTAFALPEPGAEKAETMKTPKNVTIRRTGDADGKSLVRLAGLDSKHVPPGNFLIAEVDGTGWAAVAIESGEVLADPFRHTADLVEMLQLRAARIRDVESPEPLRKHGVARLAAAFGITSSSA
jgi:hypothetical protein